MRYFRMSVLATVAALATVLGVATPAAAHTQLVESTPSSGAQLATAPAEVTLSFADQVLTMGAAIYVVDGSGRDWASTEPTVDFATVTVQLDASMPVAGYEIRWRVVAADGHPITGIIPFTIGDAKPLPRSDNSGNSGNSGNAGDPGAESGTDPAAENQSTTQDQGPNRVLLIGAGGATLAVAVFLLIQFLRRRTSPTGEDDDDISGTRGN